jgi:hypothetical protein
MGAFLDQLYATGRLFFVRQTTGVLKQVQAQNEGMDGMDGMDRVDGRKLP